MIRFDTEKHLEQAAEIYDECFEPYNGRVERSKEYWEYIVRFKAVFRNGGYDEDLFLAAVRGRKISAYAVGHRGDFHHSNPREITVYEIAHRNGCGGDCLLLLREIAEIALRSTITRINIVAPLDSEVLDLASSLGGRVVIDAHWPGHDMLKIHDLAGFIDRMAPELRERLRRSAPVPRATLAIESQGERPRRAVLRIMEQTIEASPAGVAEHKLAFIDDEALTQAMTGYRGFDELLRRRRARADSALARDLGRILFPRTTGWQSPLDTQ